MPLSPQQEEALVRAAADLPTDKRQAFLDAVSAGDTALRARLVELLSSMEKPPTAPAKETAPSGTIKIELTVADEAIGKNIGPYKLLQKIGEGGCGAVYMADQEQPVHRRVAVKVIKLGMDTKTVIARFEAERQALALMDHPNIAKVLDAGSTEAGRPYFVMELVRGIKITEYCDQNKLATRERIDLFIKICQAIQHAHQKGIIHRDIKPSNILVTLHDGVPVPKVIDFGIAKATTDQRLTDKTLFTAYEQFIGTPAYMSPEQAEMSGLDIDTRSNIYSLGVLLYELLTGRTPFDPQELMKSGLDAMRKTLRETDPVRPSTKVATLQGEELTTTAARRAVEAPRLISLLRGDLDWIVMKCLEKDRTRRYETANGLAMDVKRHLENEPVAARPPSAGYRFRKSFRRNKLAFTAAGAVTCALILGIVATAWQAIRATRAKEEALAARASESIQRKQAEVDEQKAVVSEKEAVAAKVAEAKLREQAQANELAARQLAYASDMNALSQAVTENNLDRALDLLNRQQPQPGQRDLRGWEWRYLWRQCRSDVLLTFCRIASEASALAVSSDGHWLAIGELHDKGAAVWDLRTRKEVFRTATNLNHVRVAFSPANGLLAIAGGNITDESNMLCLCDPVTQQTEAEVPSDGRCAGLAFSQDGQTLITSTYRRQFTFWRVPSLGRKDMEASDQNGDDVATGFAITPDLSLAAYSCGPGHLQNLRVVDLREGKPLWTAEGLPNSVTALVFAPDGRTLASGGGIGSPDIRLWNVATGKEIGRLKGHTAWVSSLVFWPDGKKLASASADRTIRIWDIPTGQCLDVLRGHRGEVWRLALLPDNETLISGGKDGAVCLWDTTANHRREQNITWPDIAGWCFGPHGDSVETLDGQGRLARWTGADLRQKEPLLEIGTPVYDPQFSQDGRLLAVGSTNGVVSVWDLAHGTISHRLTNATNDADPAAFEPSGEKLITVSYAPVRFHEWDLVTGSEIQSWPGPSSYNAFAVSPDGQSYVMVGYEREAVLRNLARKTSVSVPLDVLEANGADISHDGRFLAVASGLGYDRVWSTADWREVTTLRGYLLSSYSVAFSPDGTRLATGNGGPSEAIKLWDCASWQEVLTLKGSGQGFISSAFSSDGNSVGTLGHSGGISDFLNIWRAPSWEEIRAAEAKEKAAIQQP
jgi:WD40 repeat protein/serine/threonine protein kinase